MGSVLSRLVQGTNPLVSSIIAMAGGAAGGGIYLNLPGAVYGLLIALCLCALLSIVAVGTGLSGEESAPASSPSVMEAVTPAAGGSDSGPGVATETTESEASLMNAGRFADYHLAKAKRYFAVGDFKEAAYQASASLAHGGLADAQELRRKAQAAAKA